VSIHVVLSTATQLSISQKALVALPEDGNVMPKHVGATIHNYFIQQLFKESLTDYVEHNAITKWLN
jgi:hypothetical protein